MKSFTVSDFSSGLNTAKSPELLEPGQSPALSNIELLTSGAIRSRKGYTSAVSEEFSSSPIVALHRHYGDDNVSKRWCAVVGTQLWTYDGYTPAYARMEAEANISASSTVTTTVIESGAYSGGAAVSIVPSADGYARFRTPPSSRIKVSASVASLRVDGGSWVNHVGGVYTSSTLAATTHEVDIRLPLVTSYKGRVTWPGTTYGEVYRTISSGSQKPPPRVGIWFFDDGTNRYTFALAGGRGAAVPYTYACFSVYSGGAWWETSYSAITGSSQSFRYSDRPSVGWHYLEFRAGGYDSREVYLYIDGVYQNVSAYLGDYGSGQPEYMRFYIGFGLFSLKGEWNTTVDVDSYTLNGSVIDAFADWNAWTNGRGGTNQTRTIHPQDGIATTATVDYIDYITANLWVKADNTLSASTTQFSFASYFDKVYYASDYDKLRVLSGAATSTAVVAQSGTTPMGGFLLTHKDRLWITGANGEYNTLVKISRVSDPTRWEVTTLAASAAQVDAVGSGTAQKVTGFTVFNDKVVQLTNVGVYEFSSEVVQGTEADAYLVTPRVLTNRYGCVAPKSVAVAPNQLIYLGADAVYTYGMLSGVNPLEGGGFGNLSEDIEPTIQQIADKTKAVGIIYDQKYWLACDTNGNGVNSTVLVYRFPDQNTNRPGAWTRYDYTGIDIRSMLVTRGDELGLYAGTASGDIVKLDEGYADGGNSINWYYQMPPLAPGSYATVKNFRVMHLSTTADSPQDVTVSANTDDASAPTNIINVTSTSGATPKRLLVPSRGRYIQPMFSSSIQNQDAQIQSMTLTYVDTPMR